MNDNRSNEDINWLYRRSDAEPEETRVFTAEELARMNPDPVDRPRQRPEPGRYQGAPIRPAAASRTVPPPAAPPLKGRGRKRRRRHPVRNTIGLLLVAWLAFMIGTPLYAWILGTVVDASPDGERPAEQPGSAVLLVGSDGRDGLTAEERSRLGTGSAEGRRTDTMMLLYTPPSGRSALISLPRDSYVSIPGHGNNKLNAAYALGGPELLVQTVESSTGIRVDGYLEIGMLGLVDTVDALGGIEVCPEAPIQDKDSHLDLEAGCQTIDGVTALGYVRMRKADPRGDLGRIERQREVIGTVVSKAMSPIHLLNPVTYWNLNMAVSGSVGRGDETGLGQVFTIGRGFFSTALGSGLSLTVPVASDNASTDAGSAVIWDEAASSELFAAIQEGDTSDLEKFER
ncbi:LCP family protein [Tessaracoccus sp. OS52]|uniref:LCP family protein n=1 Tax=Tessaracoccus sp. OS52 TaxID=2886691 RepID=UPI001D12E534|nr:LCP family protein [Tessaracoccus sp. OS52]MCC2592349.1 LCP family protein [Tessaracoccus sp. OS52]